MLRLLKAIIILFLLSVTSPFLFSQVIVADHTVVEKYKDIPQYYIDEVKKMWVSIAGESHSEAYRVGCELLEVLDSRFQVNVTSGGEPETFTESHLRISSATWGDYSHLTGWQYSYGEEDWFTNTTAINRTKAGLQYCNDNGPGLNALGFAWCYDGTYPGVTGGIDPVYHTRWGGETVGSPEGERSWGLDSGDQSLTGNSVSMDTYLNATSEYISFCRSNNILTKILFTTGPVDDNYLSGLNKDEIGYQQYLKWRYIREYVNSLAEGYLFDYADILSYNDEGEPATTSWTDNNGVLQIFPIIHNDNYGGGYVGHIGETGALRLGKALWWLLAKMAGWEAVDTAYVPLDSLFRGESPLYTQNNMYFELGTEFQALSDGFITKARLYSHINEGGPHTVRLWEVSGTTYTLAAGPYSWEFTPGLQGWREYVLPTPVAVDSGRVYIISISTSSDNYFMYTGGFSPAAQGDYIRYQRGLYTTSPGGVPLYDSFNSCYFRDLVFALPETEVLLPGTIGSSQTIGYNTAPAALTELTAPEGGTGEYTYQWQGSPDGEVWTGITGATGQGYAPPALTESTYYRRLVSSGSLGPVASDPVLVTVIIQYVYIPLDSLFRGESPLYTQNNMFFELGSEFQALSDGFITKARLYSHINEGGTHTVRLWEVSGTTYTLAAGPYSWEFTSGIQGWREYLLPTPIGVDSGKVYIISISTSSDNYFMYTGGFSPAAQGDYIRYQRGLYTTSPGGVPLYESFNSCYFRDVVFALPETEVLLPGTIGSSQTIIYNTAPAALTEFTPPEGGTGEYTYQWQGSPDGEIWTDITGATGQGYAPPALTESTYYRRLVSSGSLGPVASDPVLVTVIIQYVYIPLDSLFRGESPLYTQNNMFFELGTEFQALSDGFITKARLYSHINEGGTHRVRLWEGSGTTYTLAAGPYSWEFTPGIQGWREYLFPTPVAVDSGKVYIISISTSNDNYFMYTGGFSPAVQGDYIRYQRGLYTTSPGGVPLYDSFNSCYFRDVIFARFGADFFTPGTIGSDQTVCSNSTPAVLTELTAPSGGTGEYSFQWQNSPDGTSWTDIPGATLSAYAPPLLAVSTSYRRQVRSGLLEPVSSDPVTITVLLPPAEAQLHDTITIENSTSATFRVLINGGTPPYTIHYTRNGVPQRPVPGYISGSDILSEGLAAGSNIFTLTSVTDAPGCSTLSLGSDITITVHLYEPVDSLFRTEIPLYSQFNMFFELGTEFQVLSDGYITKAKLYSHASEGGEHTVRLWGKNGAAWSLLAGPYAWSFLPGYQGWREFTLPAPVAADSGRVYIISISTSSDNYFMYTGGFTPAVQGDYIRYQRGLYSTSPGAVPIYESFNSCYFRDVVFALLESEIPPAGNKGLILVTPENLIQEEIRLFRNYPNPFKTETSIEFELAEGSIINIELYDSNGRKRETLLSRHMTSGRHVIDWLPENYPSGTYYLSLTSKSARKVIKLSLLK